MVQIFGNYIEEPALSQEYLIIGFSPSTTPWKRRWRTNGLSASFLADYLAIFFPGDDPNELDRRDEIKGSIRYIANELLENAMKFNDDHAPQSIKVRLELHNDSIVFRVTNTVKPEEVEKFQALIQKITTSDPYELYVHQVEVNADGSSTGSGLGLLTIINDYMAKLGWKFETYKQEPEITTVTTVVQLSI